MGEVGIALGRREGSLMLTPLEAGIVCISSQPPVVAGIFLFRCASAFVYVHISNVRFYLYLNNSMSF